MIGSSALPAFQVSCVDDGPSARLFLSGELDMAGAPVLANVISTAARRRPARIVLDMEALSFMDVSGLRAILDAARLARREGRSVVIANPLPQIVRLLELTAIDQSVAVERRPLVPVA